MFQAYGLYGHIRANQIRSVLLLVGFVALLHALLFSILLLVSAFIGGTFDEIVAWAAAKFASAWPVAMIAALVWFVIAWFAHQTLINMALREHMARQDDTLSETLRRVIREEVAPYIARPTRTARKRASR